MALQSHRALGSRFELVERLGSGAMGEVWRARDRGSGEVYAAKLLRPELTHDPGIVSRFVQERSILLSLRHPGIVRVHDLVVEGDDLAIVMDLVLGGSLGDRLRARGPLPPRAAVEVTVAVLDALHAAHAQHCLHRDVKPDNVLLTDPERADGPSVRLTDFGIARLAQESTVQATGLLGTPAYMPPELFVHGTFSAASDVYAAGVLLYELLAGRTPFAGEGTAHTIGFRHVSVAPPELPVDPALWRVLETMLAKDPTRRLPAAATATALREVPEAALDRPALPWQPDPQDWHASAEPALPGLLQVRALPADLDVGATNQHAPAEAPSVQPAAGSVLPLAPLAEVDDGSTRLGPPAPERQEPRLAGAAPAAPEAGRGRWPWVAAALVLVAGGATAAVALGGGDDERKATASPAQATDPAAGTVTAEQEDRGFATGLEVTRDVEYDPATKELRLTLTYRSGDSPLQGPFLQVLPPAAAGEDCPLPVWQNGAHVTRNIGATTGVVAPCAWSIPGKLGPDDALEVSATVYLGLDGERDAVESWLQSAAGQTDDALAATGSGSSYPVQRLQGIELLLPEAIRRDAGGIPPLRVQVVPVWPGGADPTAPLYDSFGVGASTSLLQSVAGGYDGVRMEGCDALSIAGNRRQVGLRSSSADCYLEVRVGELETSQTVTISGAGG